MSALWLWPLLPLLLVGGTSVDPTLETTRWCMGTSLRVVLVDGVPPNESAASFLDEVLAPALHWEELLSTYRDDSVVSRVHREAGERVPVPAELVDYLERARDDFRRTDGVFDILHASEPAGEAAWEALRWGRDESGPWVRAAAGTRIDPGGDGKGVAVDEIAGRLRQAGVKRALVDFGGSSWYAMGPPRRAERWTVEVVDHEGRMRGEVVWTDAALSISQTFLRDQEETPRAHIVDPAAGELVRRPRTVIVLAPTATAAEVLSTTLLIRPDLEWIESFPGASAVILEGDRTTRSPGASWFRPAR